MLEQDLMFFILWSRKLKGFPLAFLSLWVNVLDYSLWCTSVTRYYLICSGNRNILQTFTKAFARTLAEKDYSKSVLSTFI